MIIFVILTMFLFIVIIISLMMTNGFGGEFHMHKSIKLWSNWVISNSNVKGTVLL